MTSKLYLSLYPKILDYIRCIVARYDSGITNFKGSSSGVLVEMSPMVIDLADKSEFFESERTAYAVVVVDENGKPLFVFGFRSGKVTANI